MWSVACVYFITQTQVQTLMVEVADLRADNIKLQQQLTAINTGAVSHSAVSDWSTNDISRWMLCIRRCVQSCETMFGGWRNFLLNSYFRGLQMLLIYSMTPWLHPLESGCTPWRVAAPPGEWREHFSRL